MRDHTFLHFQSGPETYGLPATSVVQIIRMVACTPVPNSAPELLGLVNMRGRVLPVFDLNRALHGEERPISLRMYVVVTEVDGEPLGVVVDDVLDVVSVPEDQFQSSRALSADAPFSDGVARVGSQIFTVLNLSPLIDGRPRLGLPAPS